MSPSLHPPPLPPLPTNLTLYPSTQASQVLIEKSKIQGIKEPLILLGEDRSNLEKESKIGLSDTCRRQTTVWLDREPQNHDHRIMEIYYLRKGDEIILYRLNG